MPASSNYWSLRHIKHSSRCSSEYTQSIASIDRPGVLVASYLHYELLIVIASAAKRSVFHTTAFIVILMLHSIIPYSKLFVDCFVAEFILSLSKDSSQ